MEDTSSLTLLIEAMMLSCTIDAKENKYIVESNIAATFLQADMNNNIHILLEDTIAEMITRLDQQYTGNTYVMTNKAKQCYTYSLKGHLWETPSRITILKTIIRDTTGVVFQTQPI